MKPTELTALIVRCPDLSDGAKVTLLELCLHYRTGRFPSLNEMRRIRGTSRSTVQNHLTELLAGKYLRRIPSTAPHKAVYKISQKLLLRANGLKSNGPKLQRWMQKPFAAESSGDSGAVNTLLKEPRTWGPTDTLHYFNLLGKRLKDFVPATGNRNYHAIRRMLNDFGGGENVHKMIDWFFHNHAKTKAVYTLEAFFSRRGKCFDAID